MLRRIIRYFLLVVCGFILGLTTANVYFLSSPMVLLDWLMVGGAFVLIGWIMRDFRRMPLDH